MEFASFTYSTDCLEYRQANTYCWGRDWVLFLEIVSCKISKCSAFHGDKRETKTNPPDDPCEDDNALRQLGDGVE